MSNISDWLNDEVYPSLFERIDEVFPEHAFNRYRNGCLNQKGEINKALELLSKQSKQSKQLIQKDKEAEYSRLLFPIKEDEIKERQAGKPESIRADYTIGGEDLLLPTGAISIITAPTSHGKTTALINLLLNTTQKYSDKRFYLFSYKEDRETQRREFNRLLKALELLSKQNKQSKQLIQKDKEA